MAQNETIDINDVIESVRAAAGPKLIPARIESENGARSLLDGFAGRMSGPQAHELARTLNRHHWGTGVRNNRFLPGLSTPLIDQMISDLEHFNQVVFDLWKGDEAAALEVLDRALKDSSFLPGSGASFPTIVLYLRSSQTFAIWFGMLDEGLALAVDSYKQRDRSGGSDAYLEYCRAVETFRTRFDVEPQEVDAVLSELARTTRKIREVESSNETKPTLTAATFGFLSDLTENNEKEWFNENRNRYEADLRDPLSAVFEYIAAEYLRGLDPRLQTEVKRDAVMARMNKWSQGAPYYEYLWGAFSRDKKQDDIQLFINIDATQVRFGLYLGSAPHECRERIREAADELWHWIPPLHADHPGLSWESEADVDSLEIEGPEDIRYWAQGKDPMVALTLRPNDPLIGTDQLADAIGRLMVDLHPIAAVGWGDQVELPADIDDPTPSRPEYTFEQLAAETHLPPELLEEWSEMLRGDKRAALFFGPPGTGKTWVAERLGRYLAGAEGDVSVVQFHPSFSYEDFIEGLRPVSSAGNLTYEITPGIFKTFCDQARRSDALHVFVIDEINRAELGAVLGEVMMLLEYRSKTVPLPYSKQSFSIPKNIVLLATMNTADRSLALVDFALRRRFHAFSMGPSRTVLEGHFRDADGGIGLAMFDLVQKFVDDEDFAPGHSYWMGTDGSAQNLERVWRYELRPYLQEYWFESRSKLDDLEKEVLALLAHGT